MSTSEKLNALMRERGIGKRALARKSGVSLSTIRRMCAGDMSGSIYSWKQILDVLEADANAFLRTDERKDEE